MNKNLLIDYNTTQFKQVYMETREIEALQRELNRLGFPPELSTTYAGYNGPPGVLLPIKYRLAFGEEVMNYRIYVQLGGDPGDLSIERVDAFLRKSIAVRDRVVHGIGLRKLDDDMAAINWWEQDPNQDTIKAEALDRLWKLSQNGHPSGIAAQEQLILKYLADTQEGKKIKGLDKIRARHEIRKSFDQGPPVQFTAIQMMSLLSGRAVGVGFEESGQQLVRWYQMNEDMTDVTAMPVVSAIGNSEHFDLAGHLLSLAPDEASFTAQKEAWIKDLQDGMYVLLSSPDTDEKEPKVALAEPKAGRIKIFDAPSAGKLAAQSVLQPWEESPDPAKEKTIGTLLQSLISFDITTDEERTIREMVYSGADGCHLFLFKTFGRDLMDYIVALRYHEGFDTYLVASVDAYLKKDLPFPDVTIAGIQVLELAGRMADIPWHQEDYFDDQQSAERRLDIVLAPVQAEVDEIRKLIQALSTGGPQGELLSQALQWKYWSHTDNALYMDIPEVIRDKFQLGYQFRFEEGYSLNAREMYNLLDGRSVARKTFGDSVEFGEQPGYISLAAGPENAYLTWSLVPTREDILHYLEIRNAPELKDPRRLAAIMDGLLKGDVVIFSHHFENKGPQTAIHINALQGAIVQSRVNALHPSLQDGSIYHTIAAIEKMGFRDFERFVLRDAINGLPHFSLRASRLYAGDKAVFTLKVDDQAGEWVLDRLDGALMKEIRIPDRQLGDLETGPLDEEMGRVNWGKQDYWQAGDPSLPFNDVDIKEQVNAKAIFENLSMLAANPDLEAKWIAGALMMKHFWNTPNEYFIDKLAELKQQYEIAYDFDLKRIPDLTLSKTYNLLDGRAVQQGTDANGQEQWLKIDFSPVATGKEPEPKLFATPWSYQVSTILQALQFHDPAAYKGISERLTSGDKFWVTSIYNLDPHRLAIFADPEKQKLVYNLQNIFSPLDHPLSSLADWEPAHPAQREIGQQRDYHTHPVPFSAASFAALQWKLNVLGFDKELEWPLKEHLQIGYPRFSLIKDTLYDQHQVKATLLVEIDELAASRLKGFQLDISSGVDSIQVSKYFDLSAPDTRLPKFTLRQATNLLLGRFVRTQSPQNGRDQWYYADLSKTSDASSPPIKEISASFNVYMALVQYGIAETKDPAACKRLLQSLYDGDKVPITYTGTGIEKTRFISADPRAGDISFHEDDFVLSPGTHFFPPNQSQHPDDENNRSKGNAR